eukprot:CAMPEP_0197526268 /NCGR_PEP_ID=MMETSP1318-20131121/17091_1 /TAXON_ID=552666 /ORGANISM="Partenskyella glossopodia, Strain RCC365" /LENGTH=274 /DNA_ID=CAMNT_0043080365 /DNA_START=451 /DNA_END=1275 /DNA_ORIENTATION=+
MNMRQFYVIFRLPSTLLDGLQRHLYHVCLLTVSIVIVQSILNLFKACPVAVAILQIVWNAIIITSSAFYVYLLCRLTLLIRGLAIPSVAKSTKSDAEKSQSGLKIQERMKSMKSRLKISIVFFIIETILATAHLVVFLYFRSIRGLGNRTFGQNWKEDAIRIFAAILFQTVLLLYLFAVRAVEIEDEDIPRRASVFDWVFTNDTGIDNKRLNTPQIRQLRKISGARKSSQTDKIIVSPHKQNDSLNKRFPPGGVEGKYPKTVEMTAVEEVKEDV